jgi:hypothetical protein
MVENFPGNSRKLTSENTDATPAVEPKVEPVIVGKVVMRKTPFGKRMMKMFFSGDSDSVFGYLVRDVLVPALQDTFTDVITQGIQKAVYGTVRPDTRRSGQRSSSTVNRAPISYDRYATRQTSAIFSSPSTAARRPATRRETLDLGEIVLDGKLDAEAVLDGMFSALGQYQSVTVGTLKNLLGESSVYTDHHWGWTNLDGAGIKRVAGGYLLDFPPLEDLGQ